MVPPDRIDPAALVGSVRDYRVPPGPDLIHRISGFLDWQRVRRDSGVWPYARATVTGPGTECVALDIAGQVTHGVNFASQDYLSLSSHPEIKEAAKEAVDSFGVHSAGSPALLGNTSLSLELDRRIGAFVDTEDAILFPTGWAAGFGVIRGLVRSCDHVVIDALAHACLQEGTAAATRSIHLFRHLQVDDCRRCLNRIRAKDPTGGILVVTEGLFSMDSDTPDIAAMQALCDEYEATLLVDVAHDLGCLGPDGRGHVGVQNMLGKVDLVMGSFSKTFASNGGFVVSRSPAVRDYLRYYSPSCTFSNALSPVQSAVVLKAFDIVSTGPGQVQRDRLMRNVLSLRRRLADAGLEVYGDPSAIVSVKVGSDALARLVGRHLPALGLIANLVEFPAVPRGKARFRLQVMADHTEAQVVAAATRMREAFDLALRDLEPAEAEAAAVA
jgi:glycine C-acetyltransferase